MGYLPKSYQMLFDVIKIRAYVLRFPPYGAPNCLVSSFISY